MCGCSVNATLFSNNVVVYLFPGAYERCIYWTWHNGRADGAQSIKGRTFGGGI